jgi:hypothetical protein
VNRPRSGIRRCNHREQEGDLMVFYKDGVEQFSVQADEIKTIATANVKQSIEIGGFAWNGAHLCTSNCCGGAGGTGCLQIRRTTRNSSVRRVRRVACSDWVAVVVLDRRELGRRIDQPIVCKRGLAMVSPPLEPSGMHHSWATRRWRGGRRRASSTHPKPVP